MGLLDFFTSNAADNSAPLLAPQPPALSPQQNWMNALGVISAGLRDAGAYLQHQPQAANNVAALARRQSGLETPGASMLARLPPMITTALLLNAARQTQAPQRQNSAVSQPVGPLPSGQMSLLETPGGAAYPTDVATQNPNGGWTFERVK